MFSLIYCTSPAGCRASTLNLEAKSLHSWKTSRHCIVTRFQDLSVEQFREIRTKAGGLIVLLPRDVAALGADERQQIYTLEQAMLAQETSIPVFFARYSDEFNGLIEDISNDAAAGGANEAASKSAQRESALSELIGSVSANGYQIVVTGAVHTPNKQSRIPILQGELSPVRPVPTSGGEQPSSAAAAASSSGGKLPLIVVTAHLDTFGLTSVSPRTYDIM